MDGVKLRHLRVHGYKRFAKASTLDTRGRVIAIVGPNEAGKTSFLHAVRHLTSRDAFADHELTDREPRSSDVPLVSALFTLDDDDRSVLGDLVPAKSHVTYAWMVYADGVVRHRLRPEFPRDRASRARCARQLRTAISKGWLAELDDNLVTDDEGEERPAIARHAETLVDDLEREDDELGADITDQLGALATAIGTELPDDARKSLVALVETLRQTSAFERADPPGKKIGVS